MRIKTYRGAPFIDREEDIEFFVDWFEDVPQRILWVYGPKSSGKTTVIEYVVEKKLLKNKKFWVKYLNLREKFITSYNSFLEGLIIPEDVYDQQVKESYEFSLKVFKAKKDKLKKVKAKELDFGALLLEELKKAKDNNKICVLIIDEIQKLRDLYIKNGNGERELLKEFLNFCVRLTKELHIAHVVILTSNTVFIEKIYNDAKLKETSRFKKIDHLLREKVFEWLEIEGFNKKEIELVWEYYGGNIGRILEAIRIRKKGKHLEKFLQQEKWLAYTEILDFMARGDFTQEQINHFEEMAEEILNNGCFKLTKQKKKYLPVIETWAEKEILFYDPLELKVTGNSRIYEKGLEILLNNDNT